VEDSHPAIIDPAFFELIQHEFQRRAASGQTTISARPLSGKIFCADCGGLYGPRVWHSKSQYRTVVWLCNHKYSKEAKCPSVTVREERVKAAFLAAFNQRLDNRAAIFAAYDEALAELADTTALDAEAAELAGEREVAKELM